MNAVALIGSALKLNRNLTLSLLKDLTGHDLVYRPGGVGNHVLWNLGHIGWSELSLSQMAGLKTTSLPPGNLDAFALGSEVRDDATAYPAKESLLAWLAALRGQVLAGLANVTDAELDLPIVGEVRPGFLETRGDAWRLMIAHEPMHAGQISVIRRELGKARATA